MDTSELLPILQAAELLGFVQTPGGDVVLLPLGRRIVDADINTKKSILREQMEKLPLFRFFMDFLSNHPEKAVEKSVILEELTLLVPTESPEKQYGTLLKWGRYGEIFGFSHDTGRFFLNTRGRRRRTPRAGDAHGLPPANVPDSPGPPAAGGEVGDVGGGER
ncbi:MAG: AAA-associated domain-containing protein [Planctomycetes bacterium]|nr:AAA-associated domain-containing protein [Planctomycetota bacterium]